MATLHINPFFNFPGMGITHFQRVCGSNNYMRMNLMAYYIAQFLHKYSDKKAVVLDVSGNFSTEILVKMIWKGAINKHPLSLIVPPIAEIANTPRMNSFMNRVYIKKCLSVERLVQCVQNEVNSPLGVLLHGDRDIAMLLIIDIDKYYVPYSAYTTTALDVLGAIKGCMNANIPTICSTIRKIKFRCQPPPGEIERSTDFYDETIFIDGHRFTHTLMLSDLPSATGDAIQTLNPTTDQVFTAQASLTCHREDLTNSFIKEFYASEFSLFGNMIWHKRNSTVGGFKDSTNLRQMSIMDSRYDFTTY